MDVPKGREDAELRLHDLGLFGRRIESGEGDEIDSGEFADGVQGIAFDVARCAETRLDFVQVGVVVTGVSDQFPCAPGELPQQGAYGVCVDDAGGGDGDGSVCGGETLFGEDAAEVGSEATQSEDFGAADDRRAWRCADCPLRLEGVAHTTNAGFCGRSQDGAQDCGEHVRVLMSVDVGETQASMLEQCNLRGSLSFEFGRADAAGEEPR